MEMEGGSRVRGEMPERGRRVTLLLASAVAAVAMVMSTATAAEWTQFGHDAGRSFSQPDETSISVDSVGQLARVWRRDLLPPRYEEFAAGAAIRGGVAYVAGFGRTVDGIAVSRLYALDLPDGHVRWSTGLPGYTRWTPTIEGSVVITALETREMALGLYAVDAVTGEPRWFRRLDCRGCRPASTGTSPAVAADGVVIAAAGGISGGSHAFGRLWAFDVGGTLLWTRAIRNPGLPIVVDEAVVVSEDSEQPNADETVIAWELATGERRWRRGEGIAWTVDLSGDGDDVFVATGRRLLSVSATDGSIRWNRGMGAVVGAPIVGPSSLFISGFEAGRFGSQLAALDRETGDVRWTHDLGDFGYSIGFPTQLANGVLFVGGWYQYGDRSVGRPPTSDGFAVVAWGGRIVARLPAGLEWLDTFDGAIADGLYVRTEGTTIRAYGVPPRSLGRGS